MVLVTNTESLIVFAVSVLTNMVDTPIIAPEEVEIPSVETVSTFPDVLIHSIVLI